MLCLSPEPSLPRVRRSGRCWQPRGSSCPFPGGLRGAAGPGHGQVWADALARPPPRQPGRGCGRSRAPPPCLPRCAPGTYRPWVPLLRRAGPSARRCPGVRAPQPLPGPPPARTRQSPGAAAQREASLAKKSKGTRPGTIPRRPRLPESRHCHLPERAGVGQE